MKRKFSFWPHGITIIFLLFVIVQITVLFISGTVNNDLVTDNYYEKELIYQQQIDRMNRSRIAENKIVFKINNPDRLLLQFPVTKKGLSGTILFFRPDDRKKDFQMAVKPDEKAQQIIHLNRLQKGNWKVKVFWKDSLQDYFEESSVFIE